MATGPKHANKYDVEMQRLQNWREIGRIVAIGVLIVAGLAISTFPIHELHGIVKPLAGQHTVVEAGGLIKGGIAVSLVVNFGQLGLATSRRRELRRLRERLERHERPLVHSGKQD